MSVSKLKPCPFCGHEDIILYRDEVALSAIDAYQYIAECMNCNTIVYGELCDTETDARKSVIEFWNSRPYHKDDDEKKCVFKYDNVHGDYVCQECGAFVRTDAARLFDGSATLKYCPNCGAKIHEHQQAK